MDASLKRKAMINSGILAFMFVDVTLKCFFAGGTAGVVTGLISLLAAGLTINDTVKFYKA